ncbi:hypothetical protein MKX03_034476 [Papaver bracteatum]|nr:hypothetical protein MKX03_034476 [Papaver bracteatum]
MCQDKQIEDKYRESRYEESRKDHTKRDDKRRDDYLKDHSGQRSDNKYPRDEKWSPQEKSKRQECEGDSSPHNDDRVTNYKDSRGKKRYSDDLKSRNAKEHHHAVAEKKTPSSSREESPADRGRSQSRFSPALMLILSRISSESREKNVRGSRELPLEKPVADEIIVQPKQGGASDPSVYGLSEEDSRGKSNCYWRTGDLNVGRGLGNAWKGIPNWPSQLPNNLGFHAMMQQFPAPPLFGNHPGIPYHMPDADRFAVQMHGWHGNRNGVLGMNGNSDTRKGKKNNPAAPEKDDHGLSSTPEPAKTSRLRGAHFCHVYLSKLDISVVLTHSQLYKQCVSLSEIEGNSVSDYDSKHAHFKELDESRLKMSNSTLGASLFPIEGYCVFQRAMLLYRKQGEETQTKVPLFSLPGSRIFMAILSRMTCLSLLTILKLFICSLLVTF